jgi:hypothetical protein
MDLCADCGTSDELFLISPAIAWLAFWAGRICYRRGRLVQSSASGYRIGSLLLFVIAFVATCLTGFFIFRD